MGNELGLLAALVGVVFFVGSIAGLYVGFAAGRRRPYQIRRPKR